MSEKALQKVNRREVLKNLLVMCAPSIDVVLKLRRRELRNFVNLDHSEDLPAKFRVHRDHFLPATDLPALLGILPGGQLFPAL
jgi:hypothetical protein